MGVKKHNNTYKNNYGILLQIVYFFVPARQVKEIHVCLFVFSPLVS